MRLGALKMGVLLLGMVLLMFSCSQPEDPLHVKPKNIVVILADDHALKVTGAYGNSIINTPNIDCLAREGITFNRAYCNAPICSASRASLLTGKYPHATGVNLLFTPFPDEANTTIGEHLQKQGYRTGLFGKTHFNNWIWADLYKNGLPKHGFDTLIERSQYQAWLKKHPPEPIPEGRACFDRESISRENTAEWMNCQVRPHPVRDEDSEGTFYARQAVDFIRRHKDQPFFAWVAFKEPHHPYYFPIEYAGKYRPEDMLLPEGSLEDDRWVPEKYRGLTDDQKRGIIASYYSSTEYLDKNIGLVLDALKAEGLEEETVVMYISDNGYLLNDHKRFEKHTVWEEAVHQPMIIRIGDRYGAGRRIDALVEYIDVVPTLLDLTGVEPLEEVQGKSFLEVIESKTDQHRAFTFSEYLEDNLAMVCTRDWKYMFTTGRRDLGIGYQTGNGPSGIVHRLYNLKEDLTESHDLSKSPEQAGKLLEMQQNMLDVFMNTHPDKGSCPQHLSLEGKLVWFCEPRDIGAEQSLLDFPYRVFKE